MRTPFENLVTRLSTHFITLALEDIDSGIDQALAELGELCHVDRAYIFDFDLEGATTSNTHEWCREGIDPQRDNLQGLPLASVPWWSKRIRAGEVIHVESLRELPAEAAAEKEVLEAQSVASVVCVPLTYGAEVFGFVGFDSVIVAKRWPDADIALLRVVGEMLVHALVRQRAERQRRELEAQLGEARKLEAIGRLAGGVAHDFNNMLTVVMNLGRLLERSVSEPKHQAYAREIIETSERAAGLTHQLLSIGRRAQVSDEVVDLAQVIRELKPLLRRTTREDIAIEVHVEPVGHVRVGRWQVERVLVNLALNARDAMPDGGTLGIRLRPFLDEGHDEVELAVGDDGTGMPEEVAARAFELFFTTKGARGTGLGLATVHGIVAQSNGTIALDSRPGEGTRVVMRWPTTDAPLTTREVHGQGDGADGAGQRLLVVDDVAELRGVLQTVLEEAGYRVETAHDAASALRLVRNAAEPFELVLTDVVMPGGSGADLMKALEPLEHAPAIVVMSAYEDRILEGTRGPFARLHKPFLAEELLMAVRSALTSAQSARP